MNIIEFLSAFGLGALVTALVQAWLSHKSYISKRNFQEKKECYVGYLKAFNDQMIKDDQASALECGYWRYRIELVGSRAVIDACLMIEETNPDTSEFGRRPEALQKLKEAMRKDLDVNSGI
jgi:hypothetical protein